MVRPMQLELERLTVSLSSSGIWLMMLSLECEIARQR
jgi:hypothetical protein